jgi:hypothetical protein
MSRLCFSRGETIVGVALYLFDDLFPREGMRGLGDRVVGLARLVAFGGRLFLPHRECYEGVEQTRQAILDVGTSHSLKAKARHCRQRIHGSQELQ